jgi:hypothetical protein
MLDTNAFDYIIDNKLIDKVRNAVDNGKLRLFATDVQNQELDAIPNTTRKQAIKQVIEVLGIKFVATSGAVVASKLDRGFGGSRVGQSRVGSERDNKLLEKLTKVNIKHPLKNRADLLTFTSAKEDMDYLITGNIADFKRPLELYNEEMGTKLQIKNNKDFENML